MTSSVTLWAIHAGHSDWMPDWIIRNSAGADLKRKSGKVQHWDHTTQASSAGFSWELVGPTTTTQLRSQSRSCIPRAGLGCRPLVLQSTHNCRCCWSARPQNGNN